jgi:ankyrin repeat protein
VNYSISFLASSAGHKDTVNYLFSQGAEVNVKDDIGRTPLYLGEL